ncbi:serine/threonine protein kinase [Chamaesiphon minutus]|uniref:Serine/threonine protein kinase n=1 Tax=Chamaesiphon minutus (strain ATCC 27169 / PCC 6605) TaxID=1173020 RepID=K9U9Z3_CHAP6|nr:serine/threonine-protein kinase [Chamaesiphon minutus]AFY91917.1 serine/threonine protein kinase [Chamaesiphon minutus PCC 6605]
MELITNRVLGDRYQIESLIGRQTGRRTFLARDLHTQQAVILKLLLFGVDFTWDDLKLFEREAEVLKSLDLPAIPKYLDWFDVDTELGKGFVLVQTYIEAKSLQNWLEAGRTFSEEELIAIAKQLLAILDYLHNRQPAVIHRDIKPSNILLGDRSGNSPGQVYLVDFGSVRTATNGSTITVVGTYGYMPPEQFGGYTTPASDLYALGATIICLATGLHPSELLQKDLQIDFVERVNLSAGMINWLKSMTECRVDLRLQSATQALIALNDSNRDTVLAIDRQPFGSKIKSNITDRVFEISLPPKGFSLGIIPMLGVAVFWNGITSVFVFASLVTFISGGWMMLFFMIPFVWVGAALIWGIIFELFGTHKLRIDGSKISLFSVILGLKCMASTAPRHYLDRVELVPLTYAKDGDGNLVTVPPYLNIWAGNQQFCLDKFNLTQPEREWLIHELTDWLDLGNRIQLHT